MNKKHIIFILLFSLSCNICSGKNKISVADIYKNKPTVPYSQEKLLLHYSAMFLDTPYVLFPNGEGKHATMVKKPLYQIDKFDCLTYVETMLALALGKNLTKFKKINSSIRYAKNNKNFFARNHFTSLDWNHNNQQKGFISDITPSITSNSKHIAKSVTTLIDKPGWYKYLSEHPKTWQKYSGDQTNFKQVQKILRQHAHKDKATNVKIHFLDSKDILTPQNHIKPEIVSQLPKISIVEFVRKNWKTRKYLGTDLDISHIGFLIKDNNEVILRHASYDKKKVIDQPLSQYLLAQKESATFAGINIEKINFNSN